MVSTIYTENYYVDDDEQGNEKTRDLVENGVWICNLQYILSYFILYELK